MKTWQGGYELNLARCSSMNEIRKRMNNGRDMRACFGGMSCFWPRWMGRGILGGRLSDESRVAFDVENPSWQMIHNCFLQSPSYHTHII